MAIPSSSTSSTTKNAPAGNKSGGGKRTFGLGFLPFSCGCRGSKAASASSPSRTTTPTTTSCSSSASASASASASTSTTTTTSSGPTGRQPAGSGSLTATTAASFPSPTPSHCPALLLKQQPAEEDDGHSTPAGTPTITDLLRQLSDLEQAVMALDTTKPAVPALPDPAAGHHHQERYSETSSSVGRSMSFAAEPRAQRRVYRRSRSYGEGGCASSLVGSGMRNVAVETETKDPVGDLRRSMMEVIAQEGITSACEGEGEGVEERLRGLLRRFLEINHPSNHHYVVQAFALVLDEVCASSSSPPSSCSPTNTWVDATAPTFSADLRKRPPVRRSGPS